MSGGDELAHLSTLAALRGIPVPPRADPSALRELLRAAGVQLLSAEELRRRMAALSGALGQALQDATAEDRDH